MIQSYLYKRTIPITEKISIYVPTVGEVIDNEESYYSIITALTAMPIDFMVMLDEIGIDFTEINEYELFTYLFAGLKTQDTSLVFGNLDLSKFQLAIDEESGNVAFVDRENDIVIDRAIHGYIASILRKLHHLEKNNRKPANKEAKEFMLEREKKKQARRKRRRIESQLEPLIIALVNVENFKYNFESVRDLSIYQFNESLRQIIKKVDYDNKIYGIYAGTISAKDMNQDELNWLIHK